MKSKRIKIFAILLVIAMVVSTCLPIMTVHGETTENNTESNTENNTTITTTEATTEVTTEATTEATTEIPIEEREYDVRINHVTSSGNAKNTTFRIKGNGYDIESKTSSNGYASVQLKPGTYTVTNNSLSSDCYINHEITITVTANSRLQSFDYYTDVMGNVIVEGTIDSISKATSKNIDEGTLYTLEFEHGANTNMQYTVYAAEKIERLDGTLVYNKDAEVGVITIRDNGKGELDDLYEGAYYLVQTPGQTNHIKDDKKYEFEIKASDITNGIINKTISINESNINLKLTWNQEILGLDATKDADKIAKLATTIKYGLFTESELYAKDGTSIPANSLLKTTNVTNDLKGTIETQLIPGNYYIQQIGVGTGLSKDDTKYSFTVSADGTVDGNVKNIQLEKTISNTYFQGSVFGTLKDNEKSPIQGAKIALFAEDVKDFTLENALKATTTNKNGEFKFEHLDAGIYYITDITVPNGFELSGKTEKIEVNNENTDVEFNIVINKIVTTEATTAEITTQATTESTEDVQELIQGPEIIEEDEVDNNKANTIAIIISIIIIIAAIIAIIYFILRYRKLTGDKNGTQNKNKSSDNKKDKK